MKSTTHLTEKAKRDYKLVQLALEKGDQRAFTSLLGFYKDSLYFMLHKMTNNPVDAEDLTIEAFGKAFKYIRQYSPKFAFSTWLFKIASNNCIDFLRKKNRTQTLSIDENIDESETSDFAQFLTSTVLDPEEELIKKQKIIIMHDVVKNLKPHYKNLIELRYFNEYSYNEIAKELELPLGTVKAQLFRARVLLYQILKTSKEDI